MFNATSTALALDQSVYTIICVLSHVLSKYHLIAVTLGTWNVHKLARVLDMGGKELPLERLIAAS